MKMGIIVNEVHHRLIVSYSVHLLWKRLPNLLETEGKSRSENLPFLSKWKVVLQSKIPPPLSGKCTQNLYSSLSIVPLENSITHSQNTNL